MITYGSNGLDGNQGSTFTVARSTDLAAPPATALERAAREWGSAAIIVNPSPAKPGAAA